MNQYEFFMSQIISFSIYFFNNIIIFYSCSHQHAYPYPSVYDHNCV